MCMCVCVCVCTDRVEIFLEVYGNALVREKTAALIAQKAAELVKYVSVFMPVAMSRYGQ